MIAIILVRLITTPTTEKETDVIISKDRACENGGNKRESASQRKATIQRFNSNTASKWLC